MTPEQALRDAASGELRPVYLVLGDDQFARGRVVSALREATIAGGIAGLNEDQLVAGEVGVEVVLAAARTLPMMARRRFVGVRSLERYEPREGSKGPDALEQLASYAEHASPSTTLVLVAEKLDKRRRLVSLAYKAGFVVDCPAPSRLELPGWIERAAKVRGNRLAPGIADLLAELTGPELGSVADALERLCLFAGEGRDVDEDAVAECIVQVRPATVWELVDAVGRRDLGAALSVLERVYDPQDRGLRLVGVLAWSARQLLRFEAALRAGAAPPEAAKRAGAAPFKARELSQQVKRIPRADMERWLETLAEVDLALKGGSKRAPKAVLEQAVIGLCSAPGRATSRSGSPLSPGAARRA
jgi:DNA polymerase-3 subunit delta